METTPESNSFAELNRLLEAIRKRLVDSDIDVFQDLTELIEVAYQILLNVNNPDEFLRQAESYVTEYGHINNWIPIIEKGNRGVIELDSLLKITQKKDISLEQRDFISEFILKFLIAKLNGFIAFLLPRDDRLSPEYIDKYSNKLSEITEKIERIKDGFQEIDIQNPLAKDLKQIIAKRKNESTILENLILIELGDLEILDLFTDPRLQKALVLATSITGTKFRRNGSLVLLDHQVEILKESVKLATTREEKIYLAALALLHDVPEDWSKLTQLVFSSGAVVSALLQEVTEFAPRFSSDLICLTLSDNLRQKVYSKEERPLKRMDALKYWLKTLPGSSDEVLILKMSDIGSNGRGLEGDSHKVVERRSILRLISYLLSWRYDQSLSIPNRIKTRIKGRLEEFIGRNIFQLPLQIEKLVEISRFYMNTYSLDDIKNGHQDDILNEMLAIFDRISFYSNGLEKGKFYRMIELRRYLLERVDMVVLNLKNKEMS